MLHIKRNGNMTYIHTFQKALQWVAKENGLECGYALAMII